MGEVGVDLSGRMRILTLAAGRGRRFTFLFRFDAFADVYCDCGGERGRVGTAS